MAWNGSSLLHYDPMETPADLYGELNLGGDWHRDHVSFSNFFFWCTLHIDQRYAKGVATIDDTVCVGTFNDHIYQLCRLWCLSVYVGWGH